MILGSVALQLGLNISMQSGLTVINIVPDAHSSAQVETLSNPISTFDPNLTFMGVKEASRLQIRQFSDFIVNNDEDYNILLINLIVLVVLGILAFSSFSGRESTSNDIE